MKQKIKARRLRKHQKRRVTAIEVLRKTRNFQVNGKTFSFLFNKVKGKLEAKPMCEECFADYALAYNKCRKCLNASASAIQKEHGIEFADIYLGKL